MYSSIQSIKLERYRHRLGDKMSHNHSTWCITCFSMVLLTSSQFMVPVSYTLLVKEFPWVAAAVDTEFAGTKAVDEGLDEEEESSMAACASGVLRVNQEGLLTLFKNSLTLPSKRHTVYNRRKIRVSDPTCCWKTCWIGHRHYRCRTCYRYYRFR